MMKISVISDTHELHEELGTLSGDVLIHCGDSANGFSRHEAHLQALDDWFGRQAFELVLMVGGNHDFELERRAAQGRPVFEHAVYLQDESTSFRGIRFHGAPWVPELSDWAFYQPPEELARRWARVPADTDVLITHTPPRGILDCNSRGKACGCVALRERVRQVRPRVHCFGHVHASSGSLQRDDTQFINASMVNSQYELVRSPYQLEL